MDEVRLRGRGGCVERIFQEMLLGVDTLLPMWKERGYCLRFRLYRHGYGVIEYMHLIFLISWRSGYQIRQVDFVHPTPRHISNTKKQDVRREGRER